MRTILLSVVFSLMLFCHARGQSSSDVYSMETAPTFDADTMKIDSVSPPVTRHLLPDNMSFMEKGLWGEHGFFRGIGIAGELTPEERKNELGVRRTMLTLHQIGGPITLGAMGFAVWYGQKSLDHPAVRQYRQWHQTAVTATIISYSLTGLLAALSPPPLIRRNEVSTISIHKGLAWIHFAGMVLTPILGSMLHRGRTTNYGSLAHFHQASGYVTTAAMAASLIVVTF